MKCFFIKCLSFPVYYFGFFHLCFTETEGQVIGCEKDVYCDCLVGPEPESWPYSHIGNTTNNGLHQANSSM